MKDRDREDDRDTRERGREERSYEENGATNGDDRKGMDYATHPSQ